MQRNPALPGTSVELAISCYVIETGAWDRGVHPGSTNVNSNDRVGGGQNRYGLHVLTDHTNAHANSQSGKCKTYRAPYSRKTIQQLKHLHTSQICSHKIL